MSHRINPLGPAVAAVAVLAFALVFQSFCGSEAMAQRRPSGTPTGQPRRPQPTPTPTPAPPQPVTTQATKPASATLPSSVAYGNGQYTGSAKGYNGNVDVTVKIAGGMIDSIILKHVDTPHYFRRAFNLVPNILQQQTTAGVDTISGATISSKAILAATKTALDKAQKAAPKVASKPATEPAPDFTSTTKPDTKTYATPLGTQKAEPKVDTGE